MVGFYILRGMKKYYKQGISFGLMMLVFFLIRDFLRRNIETPKDYFIWIFTGLIGATLAGAGWGFFYKKVFLSKEALEKNSSHPTGA